MSIMPQAVVVASRGRYAAFCAMILPVALVLSGCSELTSTMTGSVYLDGKLISINDQQRGMVVFRPVAGGATCTGLIDKEGAYLIATGSADALPPGDYLVSVRVVELIQPEVEGRAPKGKSVTPAVYADPLTSGLSVLVRRGANRYDIKMESPAAAADTSTESDEAGVADSQADAAPLDAQPRPDAQAEEPNTQEEGGQ